MASYSDDSDAICIIHFSGKGGEVKKLTNETLAKIIDVRKQWLGLSSSYQSFTAVAKKSLELFGDSFTDEFSVTNLAETHGYHLGCYRMFTDISKLNRAKTTIANTDRKRSVVETIDQTQENVNIRPEKVARTTRQTLQRQSQRMINPPCRSSNVLPEICLICKRPGPLFLTDQVFIFYLIWQIHSL